MKDRETGKHKNIKRMIFSCLIMSFSLSLVAQGSGRAFEVNKRLGRGVNIGNTFEAPTETAWGNSWDASYLKIIADLGFSHVRLPVRWETSERTMATAPYTISADFLERIKSVVDEAISNNLYIIVNMHHHEALYKDPAGQKARFLSQWRQIADCFREYPDKLLFEIMNEPQEKLSDADLWNQFFADALSEVRKTNPDRCVLVCSSNWGGINGVNLIELPDDENLILTVHYYNPFDFTHQGADWANMEHVSGVEWLDTELERDVVRQEFREVRVFAEKHNIPVHVGEFGAYSRADLVSRAKWTTFVARFFEEQGYSWAYWEFNAGFGFYNPDTKTFVQPLVDALLHNSIPDPTPVTTSLVYESDFKNSGLDGWYFQANNGAEGSTSIRNDILDINVNAVGTESWHIQLMKQSILIENEQQYRLSFKASAAKEFSASSHVGRNASPWDAYSNYQSFLFSEKEESFSYTFTMKSSDDPNARICFDLGAAQTATTISLRDVKLEKIHVGDVSNTILPQAESDIVVSGGKGQISVLNATSKRIFVYSVQGKLLAGKILLSDNEIIQAPPGIFIVSVESRFTQKVIVK